MSNPLRGTTRSDASARGGSCAAAAALTRDLAVAGLVVCFVLVASQELRSQSPPGRFDASEALDARPIWAPVRPGGSQQVADTERTSSTLRLVREGWGQSRPETVSTSSSNVLRWRSRTAEETQTATVDDGSIPLTAANGQTIVEAASEVRTVAHQQPTDAFQDPFGDRLAQNRDSRYQAADAPGDEAPAGDAPSSLLPTLDQLLPPYQEPESSEPMESTEDSPLPGLDDAPAPSTLPEPPAFPETQPKPQPAAPQPKKSAPPIFQPTPPSTLPATPPSKPARTDDAPPPLAAPAPSVDSPATIPDGGRGETDCQRVYNDRNCCREDEKCQAARLALRQNSIRNISLDITASFKPDAKTAEEEREAAQNQLRRMPSRVWKGRTGDVLAEGRVVHIHNRRIDVQQEDGSIKTIPLGHLGEDETCFLAAWWQVPTECTFGFEQPTPRIWQPVTFTWKASAVCHKPLYFEERMLERYGHTTGPITEPILSGAHFFLNVAVLPYKMGMNPPNECQYPLGYYRPGSCAPRLLPPVPISPRGALLQAGAVLGAVYLIP